MKTNELPKHALNWAVAKCLFVPGTANSLVVSEVKPYSSEWAHGGPIIEREGISVMLSFRDSYAEGANAKPSGWCARKYQYGVLNEPLSHGPTPLIAAMRCYVASELGDEIDVPDELKGE